MALNRRAQSLIEYAMLFAIVVAAFLSTIHFVTSSAQGRLRQAQEEINADE